MKFMHTDGQRIHCRNWKSKIQIFKLDKKVCNYTILIDAFIILPIDHSYAEYTENTINHLEVDIVS